MNPNYFASKEFIISAVALLTSIANIVAMIFNTTRLEKFKKKLDIRTLRLTRLWDLRKELAGFSTDGNINDIFKHSEDSDFQERVDRHVESVIRMYNGVINLYLVNKSFFFPASQKEIETNFNNYNKLQETLTSLILQKDKAADYTSIYRELNAKIFQMASDGIELTVNKLHQQIEKLEKEML